MFSQKPKYAASGQLGHRGDGPQDDWPVVDDQFRPNLSADQTAQFLRRGGRVEEVEPFRWQITDARDKVIGQQRRDSEDVIREAAGVGVLLFDFAPDLVHQQPIQDVGRFVDGGRDVLGGERAELVGDVGIGFQAGLGAILGPIGRFLRRPTLMENEG